MVEKDDWRLLNDIENLKSVYMHPTDGKEIRMHAPHLKRCKFYLDKVHDHLHQWWYVTEDLSECICEECYNDLKDAFAWRELDGWDIDWFVRCPKCGEILSKTSLSQNYVYECLNCHILYSWDLHDDIQLD